MAGDGEVERRARGGCAWSSTCKLSRGRSGVCSSRRLHVAETPDSVSRLFPAARFSCNPRLHTLARKVCLHLVLNSLSPFSRVSHSLGLGAYAVACPGRGSSVKPGIPFGWPSAQHRPGLPPFLTPPRHTDYVLPSYAQVMQQIYLELRLGTSTTSWPPCAKALPSNMPTAYEVYVYPR